MLHVRLNCKTDEASIFLLNTYIDALYLRRSMKFAYIRAHNLEHFGLNNLRCRRKSTYLQRENRILEESTKKMKNGDLSRRNLRYALEHVFERQCSRACQFEKTEHNRAISWRLGNDRVGSAPFSSWSTRFRIPANCRSTLSTFDRTRQRRFVWEKNRESFGNR